MKKLRIGILAGLLITISLLSAFGCDEEAVDDAAATGIEDVRTDTVTEAAETEPGITEPIGTQPGEATPAEPSAKADASATIALTCSGSMDFREADLPFRKDIAQVSRYDFDERYVLFLSYEGKLDETSLRYVMTDAQMAVLDKKEGRFLDEVFGLCETTLTSAYSIDYEDGYCVLYVVVLNEETWEYSVEEAWRVDEDNGVFRVEKTVRDAYPQNAMRYSSPDGKYTVYRTLTDGHGAGGILLEESGGGTTEVLTNRILTPDGDITDVRGYTPVGFLDDTHFLYNIGGWEWAVGWGIYDVKARTAREFDNGQVIASYDRAAQTIVTQKVKSDYTVEWYEAAPSGDTALICRDESGELPEIVGETPTNFAGHWLRLADDRLEVLSSDRTTVAAALAVPGDSGFWREHPDSYYTALYFYGNTLTFVQ